MARDEERTREWAIANKKFSLKLKGIVWTPDGESLEVPNGIIRYKRDPEDLEAGWDLYYFDLKGKYRHTRVKDKMHDGDYKKSLAAAITLYKHRSLCPLLKGRSAHCLREHKHKKNKIDHPGIRFGKAYLSKRKINTYFFAVTVGNKRKTVYVGMDTTWEQNYDEKFEVAKMVHKQLKDKHLEEHAFLT